LDRGAGARWRSGAREGAGRRIAISQTILSECNRLSFNKLRFEGKILTRSKPLPRPVAAIPRKAIELLQPASRYELGWAALVYPNYGRGQAYLQMRQGKEAAAEFQEILDHRGLCMTLPVCALSRLQLARARELSGDAQGARTAYQDFFALWKDADPDIPILKQAKAGYAKLQ
jgi:tetratricopeptide (TPR) repeat protein